MLGERSAGRLSALHNVNDDFTNRHGLLAYTKLSLIPTVLPSLSLIYCADPLTDWTGPDWTARTKLDKHTLWRTPVVYTEQRVANVGLGTCQRAQHPTAAEETVTNEYTLKTTNRSIRMQSLGRLLMKIPEMRPRYGLREIYTDRDGLRLG